MFVTDKLNDFRLLFILSKLNSDVEFYIYKCNFIMSVYLCLTPSHSFLGSLVTKAFLIEIVVVVVNFSHCCRLLQNWASFIQTWHKHPWST